ncbi:Uncharacterised protein [Vibrio cholerae]|nr:Uncharacterised protein [Vibrio cholerae]
MSQHVCTCMINQYCMFKQFILFLYTVKSLR